MNVKPKINNANKKNSNPSFFGSINSKSNIKLGGKNQVRYIDENMRYVFLGFKKDLWIYNKPTGIYQTIKQGTQTNSPPLEVKQFVEAHFEVE